MFIDKKQMEINYIDDADEYLQRIMAIVDGKVIDNEPVRQQLPSDGSEYGSDEKG